VLILKKEDIFTSLVRIKGSNKFDVAPVKSSKPIDKSLWLEMSKVLSRVYIGVPVNRGDIICKNVMNTGIDIICTKTMTKDE
jgi:CxxC motif-containing protein